MEQTRQTIHSKSELPFRGREPELESLLPGGAKSRLQNVYGVSGIGKSRLLREVADRVRESSPGAIVIRVDLETLPRDPSARPRALLEAIVEQEPGRLRGLWHDTEQVAGEIAGQLDGLASSVSLPVYLMFDSTEHVQQDAVFWRWAEANLIGPLVVEENVRLVFAGRVPAPWRRFEVRSAVRLLSLSPLSQEGAAQQLIADALRLYNSDLSSQVIDRAVPFLLDLSFGHPLLSEELAEYTASSLPAALEDEEKLRRELCAKVVAHYIEENLFKDLDPPWPEILEWTSVLDRFDPQLLRRYLTLLDAKLAEQPEYFFIQGVAAMRIQHALVWYEGEGYVIHGVLKDILRHNLEILKPDMFRQACRAAVQVYQEMASELAGTEEAAQYSEAADRYRELA